MTIYLHDKRRRFADVASKLQHLVGGLPLLREGMHRFAEGSERFMTQLKSA